jgi:pimeloyl-ACP methyl ester carboxylesterase
MPSAALTDADPPPAKAALRPRRKGLMALLWLLAGIGALYAALVAALWWGQEKLLFHPEPLPAKHRFDVPADVHETWVEVPGARLNALHLQLPHPDGVVFFLHGNAGNLDSWFVNTGFYRRANLDLFMIDYRGYGKSSGHIESQAQLEADVRAAWAQVAPLYAGRKRVIYGRSLGTGLAATLAAEVQPELTVLVSPYSSMAALAAEHYPWVPGAVLRYPLRTDQALAQVRGPVLLVHGASDTLIAPGHSRRLQAVSPQARLLLVPGAGHGDLHDFPAYLDGLAAAMAAR